MEINYYINEIEIELGVTRTKGVSPAIYHFRGKPYFIGPFGYNSTAIPLTKCPK
jgi:hypothetical protein